MRYNPRFSTVITTPLTPELVSLTLREHTAARYPGLFFPSGSGDFFGQVGTDKFRIIPVISYRNSFVPIIHGTVTPSDRGSTVSLDMQLHFFVKSFSFVWLMFCSFFLLLELISQTKDFIAWFVPLYMFAFERLLTHFAFSYGVKKPTSVCASFFLPFLRHE